MQMMRARGHQGFKCVEVSVWISSLRLFEGVKLLHVFQKVVILFHIYSIATGITPYMYTRLV